MAVDTPVPLDNAVEIDWFAEGDVIRVVPRDLERFEIHKDRAIRVLQLANEGEKQLQLLISRLLEWTKSHSQEVAEGYLTLRDSTFVFFAINRTVECSDETEDAISDLDLEIANDPDLDTIRLNAMLLPMASPESLHSFFNDKFLLVFRGART
jgi:hypothetical protein